MVRLFGRELFQAVVMYTYVVYNDERTDRRGDLFQ
jgi:hypothetical protein